MNYERTLHAFFHSPAKSDKVEILLPNYNNIRLVKEAPRLGLHPLRATRATIKPHPIGINRTQSSSTSVAARVDDVGKGGPLCSPVAGGLIAFPLQVTTSNR